MSAVIDMIRSAILVFEKDVRIELRTKEIVTTSGFFAALVAIIAAITFYGGVTASFEVGPVPLPSNPAWPNHALLPSSALVRIAVQLAPGTIWLAVAFASVLALGRTWGREREESALTGLLVSPIPRASIFLGKAAGVLAFVLAVECIVVPIVALMFHIDLADVAGALAVVLFVGTIGVAATGTLFGAMTVRTRARDLLLASVLFPLLSPTLLSGVAATRDILDAAQSASIRSAVAQLGEVRDYLMILVLFDLLAIAGGIALFGSLVED
jgi:heme exporter protein B